MKIIYFVGTAGSGKSTLVSTYRSWLLESGIDTAVLNLDPGADALPYEADVDIREWVSMNEVMDEYGLGPNGAQVVAADLMALNAGKLTDAVNEMKSTFLLVDTPGQLELFAFRESSNMIMDALGKERSMTVYLLDPMLCRSPNGFFSSMVLSSLVQFRLGVPMINVLTKTDTVDAETVDRMILWHNDEYALYSHLMDESTDPSTVVGQE
ncbi:MAG: GTPase, partial [Thermoplasmatales archaeon]|nr:GTPase [Thermoplasmatales archaeon]